MSYAVLTNADAVTQYQGMVVRKNTSGTCVLALADTVANSSDLLGCRRANVAPAASGTVAGLVDGVTVRLAGAASDGELIYLSSTVAGVGTNVAPDVAVLLGYAYHTYSVAGVWYAELIVLGDDQSMSWVLGADVSATNTTTFAPLGSFAVKDGQQYDLEALLCFKCDAAGGIKLRCTFTGSLGHYYQVIELYSTTPTPSLVQNAQVNAPAGLANDTVSATGMTEGYVKVRGSFQAVGAATTIDFDFAQSVANANPTTIYAASFIQIAPRFNT